ncbi:unnamed protein product [Pieris macdunnoughi]|uniref:Uncharacterized protein n=1 Tax=Pieris macdunnoughi TaxID=345717 RepID=A0A821VGQ0_9NEOP|nr:unnamed protein product [Pieris macdunnoughi]
MDPKTLLAYVPSYNGDPNRLYNYLNRAKQWLMRVGGESPDTTMLLISKLEGKAAACVSMMDHELKWANIEEILKSECGDNRELNTLLIEIVNLKRKNTYSELIFELKQKLFYMKSKLMDTYRDRNRVEDMMIPYVNVAQNTLRNNLPYHDQNFISNCSFTESVNRVLNFEAEGRFDNIKQKFSQILPPPKIIQNYIKPHYPMYNAAGPSYQYPRSYNIPQQHSRHVYPPTQRSINQRIQSNRPNNAWIPNPNNVFTKPKHDYFRGQQQHYPNQKFQQNRLPNETTDVSMRTAPHLRPGQINLGKGMVAEEVFFHEENMGEDVYYGYPHEYEEYGEQAIIDESSEVVNEENFQSEEKVIKKS